MHTQSQSYGQKGTSAPPVIDVELLALDLTSCTRCVGTLTNIKAAIDTVRPILEVTGAHVLVRRILIESEEQARQYQFVASPSIRINGRDIAFETVESECEACTDLCGCKEATSCRVWRYRGEEYTEAPVGLIVEAMLREVFGGKDEAAGDTPGYQGVPDNLRRFLAGTSAAPSKRMRSCCPPAEQEPCCEAGEQAACSDTSGPRAFGYQ